MDSSQKVQNPTSSSAALTVLIFAFLSKGLLSQKYTLMVPDSVTVQRGLCIHIPCRFTSARPGSGKHYGYWFQKQGTYWHYVVTSYMYHAALGVLVATNDYKVLLTPSVENRFKLTGQLTDGNCSFSILNAKAEDAGEYYFRIESENMTHSYKTSKHRSRLPLEVRVTELTEKPQIRNYSVVLSEKEASFACSAPGPCFKMTVKVSWSTLLLGYRTSQWSQQHSNGSWTYGSDFNFTPSTKDQGKWLTCRVWYPHVKKEVTNTILVDVTEPVQPAKKVVNATRNKWTDQRFLNSVSRNQYQGSLAALFFIILYLFNSSQHSFWTSGSRSRPEASHQWHLSGCVRKFLPQKETYNGMPENRRHRQSVVPPRKVMTPASFSAAFLVLITAGPCQGWRSQNLNYNLTVPLSVSVQRGLCVHIPCSFTYDQKDRTSPVEIYGYWFLYNGNKHYFDRSYRRSAPGTLVATNDRSQELWQDVVNRFQLTGNPEEGNCSFSILNAKKQDEGGYYFRIEDSSLRFSYTHQTTQVHVTELEKPQIWASTAVLLGKEATYTCLAPGPCIKTEPRISWITPLSERRMPQWSQQHSNGSWTYGSNFTFTPFSNDQDKQLTCRVWYPHVQTYVENSISLDIVDPPKTVSISTNATDHRHLALCSSEGEEDLDHAVAQEGETVSLHCNAKGKPAPTLNWMKGNETLRTTKQGRGRILLLSEVRPDNAGEYRCRAETPYGSANKTLRLCVLYSPRLSSNQSGSTCWEEDHSLHCNCSLNSWPPSQIQWEVDGQTLHEDSIKGGLQVMSRAPQENTVISSLKWTTGNLEKSHNIICVGANPLGVYTMHFLFSPPAKGSHLGLAISGFCGALVAFILCMLGLGLIKFYKQRKGKASSKADVMEVLNSVNGGHQRANDGSLIYGNISPLGKKSPCSDQPKAAREKLPEPDELYYASPDFSKLKLKEPTPPEEFVEYSEVKQK